MSKETTVPEITKLPPHPTYGEHMCHLCADTPVGPYRYERDRKCAFRNWGTFTEDNHNCATMAKLSSLIEWGWENPGNNLVQVTVAEDTWTAIIDILPLWGDFDCDPTHLILKRYKGRANTQMALVVGDADSAAQPLTIAMAKLTIERYMGVCPAYLKDEGAPQ